MTRTNKNRSHRFFTSNPAARLLLLAMVVLTFLSLAADAQAQRRGGSKKTQSAAPARSTSSSSSSYAATSSRTTFGGEFALNYTMISAGELSLNGVGFQIAGLADFPVAPKTGIIAKVGYESKHGTTSISEGGASLDVSTTLNYIELSGLVRHDISSNVSLLGGIAIGLDAGGSTMKMKLSTGGSSTSGGRNGDLSMPTQFALVAGAGYRIPVSPTMELVPNATFNLGLTSPSPDGSSSAHTFRIGAQLMFR